MSVPKASDRNVVVPAKWWEILPRRVYSTLERVKTSQPWFEVYKVDPGIYVIYEPYQFEEAISYLVLGEEKAALIDTGCGIADIRRCVEELTKLPVMVVNTHAHNDHVAQDYMFKEVAIFDGPMAREVSRKGYDNAKMAHLVAEGMTWKPLPKSFDVKTYHVPPFKVTRWLHDGDVIDLGGRKLEVFYTPGHSNDSVCMLERETRLFWVGDLFYTGGIYTYLAGGDIPTFIKSYKRMIDLMPHYDRLMPSHNEPLVEKEILLKVYEAIQRIAAGEEKNFIEGMDDDVKVRRYNYERFSIVTKAE
jgi:glyoxylase-like metal-dependent hydrolase (beta-lactamase superfamily II)